MVCKIKVWLQIAESYYENGNFYKIFQVDFFDDIQITKSINYRIFAPQFKNRNVREITNSKAAF